MLEKMGEFFDARLSGYEEHQLTCIEFAEEFYPFTAEQLPVFSEARVLDLGCGTGLELNEYFKINPAACVTGIDLAPGMLAELKHKFYDKNIYLIQGSYFDALFGKDAFDAVVSVESLHHFTQEQKIPLYKKIYDSLKCDGYFILTDYFAETDDQEKLFRSEYNRLKQEQGIIDDEFYHYDTPLTVEHELEALRYGGFPDISILGQWGATYTIKAKK